MKEYDEFDDLDDEVEVEVITMIGDNGEELEFLVVDSVNMDGSVYLLLISTDDYENDEADAYIFKHVADEGDDAIFEEPTDEEFEKVSRMFDENKEDFDIGME